MESNETLILTIDESSKYKKTLTRIDTTAGHRSFRLAQSPNKGRTKPTVNVYTPEQAVSIMRFYGMSEDAIRTATR